MSHAHPLGTLADHGPSMTLYVLAQFSMHEGFRLLHSGQFARAASDFNAASHAARIFARGSAEAGDPERAHRWQLVARARARFADQAQDAADYEHRVMAGVA